MKVLFIISFLAAGPSLSAQVHRGLGVTYADSAELASQSYMLPPKSVRGAIPQVKEVRDLSGDFPPVGNQGDIGSCSSWASVYALRSFLQKKKMGGASFLNPNGSLNKAMVFSPLFIFNQVKDVDRRCDSVGSAIIRNMRRMKDNGVCKLSTFDPLPYQYPCCTVDPLRNSAAIQEAGGFKIAKYGWSIRYGQAYTPGYKVSVVREYIRRGYPVVISFGLDSSFYNTGGQWQDSVFVWRKPDGYCVGSHAVTCVGFNDSLNAIRIINSWGTCWGNKGYGYISYKVADDSIAEAYVMEPGDDVVDLPGGALTNQVAEPQFSNIIRPQEKDIDKSYFTLNKYQAYYDIRIMPVQIDSPKRKVVFKAYAMEAGKSRDVEVFQLGVKDTHDIINNNLVYTLTLDNIKMTNDIPSQFAAYYTLHIAHL